MIHSKLQSQYPSLTQTRDMIFVGIFFSEFFEIFQWALNNQIFIFNLIPMRLITKIMFEKLLIDSKKEPKNVNEMDNFIILRSMLKHQFSITKKHGQIGKLTCYFISVTCMLLWKITKKLSISLIKYDGIIV